MGYDKIKLEEKLKKINGRGYKAYKEIIGTYHFGLYTLSIDRVQSDPFAPPSKIRILLNRTVAGFNDPKWDEPIKKTPLEDFLTREIYKNIIRLKPKISGSGKSGLILIDVGGQQIIKRSAVVIDNKFIQARIKVGLPAQGRRIESIKAHKIFFEIIPKVMERSLFLKNLNEKKLIEFVNLYEEQEIIRSNLSQRGLVAFIANGSILPRESGISDKPMKKAILFKSPKEMEVEFDLPYSGEIKGMGIPKGITLIVGGGYHGKSTLLRSLERGVYNHIPGDGREFVITTENAIKIRAEDGRSIVGVNIDPFISNLPLGEDTFNFSTQNASGSTSQAANIIEALESGADLLLLDEDTSATNFMIRDGRMQKLVTKDNEPITPFIDRVREIYNNFGVSTIIVLGGSGDYFDVADKVIMLKNYIPYDVSEEAKKIALEVKNNRKKEPLSPFDKLKERIIEKQGFNLSSRGKVKAKGKNKIIFDKEEVDLSYLEQLVDESQTRTIAAIFLYLAKDHWHNLNLNELVNFILEKIKTKGLDVFKTANNYPDDLALPRKLEITGALNRFRRLKVKN